MRHGPHRRRIGAAMSFITALVVPASLGQVVEDRLIDIAGATSVAAGTKPTTSTAIVTAPREALCTPARHSPAALRRGRTASCRGEVNGAPSTGGAGVADLQGTGALRRRRRHRGEHGADVREWHAGLTGNAHRSGLARGELHAGGDPVGKRGWKAPAVRATPVLAHPTTSRSTPVAAREVLAMLILPSLCVGTQANDVVVRCASNRVVGTVGLSLPAA